MQQLPITPKQMADLMNLMRTEPGKQLVGMIKKEQGAELSAALQRKDFDRVGQIVNDFLEKPRVKELLNQLGK